MPKNMGRRRFFKCCWNIDENFIVLEVGEGSYWASTMTKVENLNNYHRNWVILVK